jgi:hypothetical protein
MTAAGSCPRIARGGVPWLFVLLLAGRVDAEVFRVGPDRTYRVPSEVAALVEDGDRVEIDAGVYPGDAAVWRADGLTLVGVGGLAHLRSGGVTAEDKAVWVIRGSGVIVEGVELSGARSSDFNGAGIRHEGGDLTIRDSVIHGNEMGLLTRNGEPDAHILIERSEFAANGVDYRRHGRLGHNIYIGRGAASFTLRYSHVHGAVTGHNVKSRAARNRILCNRIGDGGGGASSYLIDIAEPGETLIAGNLLYQGSRSENPAVVSYAAEQGTANAREPPHQVALIHNTAVSNRGGVFVNNHAPYPVLLRNNLLVGLRPSARGPVDAAGDLVTEAPGLVDRAGHDWRLMPASPAVDAGVALGAGASAPRSEYRHPLGSVPRVYRGAPDAGAHEFHVHPDAGGH